MLVVLKMCEGLKNRVKNWLTLNETFWLLLFLILSWRKSWSGFFGIFFLTVLFQSFQSVYILNLKSMMSASGIMTHLVFSKKKNNHRPLSVMSGIRFLDVRKNDVKICWRWSSFTLGRIIQHDYTWIRPVFTQNSDAILTKIFICDIFKLWFKRDFLELATLYNISQNEKIAGRPFKPSNNTWINSD